MTVQHPTAQSQPQQPQSTHFVCPGVVPTGLTIDSIEEVGEMLSTGWAGFDWVHMAIDFAGASVQSSNATKPMVSQSLWLPSDLWKMLETNLGGCTRFETKNVCVRIYTDSIYIQTRGTWMEQRMRRQKGRSIYSDWCRCRPLPGALPLGTIGLKRVQAGIFQGNCQGTFDRDSMAVASNWSAPAAWAHARARSLTKENHAFSTMICSRPLRPSIDIDDGIMLCPTKKHYEMNKVMFVKVEANPGTHGALHLSQSWHLLCNHGFWQSRRAQGYICSLPTKTRVHSRSRRFLFAVMARFCGHSRRIMCTFQQPLIVLLFDSVLTKHPSSRYLLLLPLGLYETVAYTAYEIFQFWKL